jgi:chromate reductase
VSAPEPRLPRLLGLSGSLRRESFNTAVLATLQAAIAERARLEIFPLGAIPLYDQDLDGEDPPAPVRALKEAVTACDGIVVCSPEYNYGIPGVLKNALDWASRPAYRSPLVGKPVVVMTASLASTGGARAQAQIRDVFFATLARVVPRPEVAIAAAHEKVKEGRLVHEPTLRFALAAVDDLLREIGTVR